MRSMLIAILSLALVPVSVLAQDAQPTTPKQAAEAIETALRKGENPGVALKNAEALRDEYDHKAMAPVVKAAGLAFRGDKRLPQCLALDTYAVLGVPGSTKQFEQLLDVPEHVEGTLLRNTYALAIKTAGTLHEKDGLKPLESLLTHSDKRFARTAAESLAGYAALPEKDLAKLLKRLVKTLGKIERKQNDKDEEVAERAAAVTKALDASLGVLSGVDRPDASEASDDAEPSETNSATVATVAPRTEPRTADEWDVLLAQRAKARKR